MPAALFVSQWFLQLLLHQGLGSVWRDLFPSSMITGMQRATITAPDACVHSNEIASGMKGAAVNRFAR
jgi:hypothetical protein